MKRTPTTNPKVNELPMSFVKLTSRVASDYGYRKSEFKDSRNVPYKRGHGGAIERVKQTR
jgi:hypothetical protein